MNLTPGQDLLHYKLIEKIGEGGMGVVWKAEDTTLNREIAIKVLPQGFAGDPDRLARFEREAKLLASLNHPNIAGIYGIHNADDVLFLAMELVDGDDLAQRLARGALSRDEALRVGLQIAQAFEAAHESGVIHRDLKPANVKLTASGQVKVLDFGLAKALSADPSEPGVSASLSPTLTSTGTMAGALIGTAAYMSPEQAKGKQVDRRADIWSFGVVLHEMLTGRRLFEGEGISETLAAVIMKDVEFASLPGHTPRAIQRLLERCLERDPNKRLRDIGDARIRIEEALAAPEEPAAAASAGPAKKGWTSFLPWAIAALSLAALAVVALTKDAAAEPGPVMRFTMVLADGQRLDDAPIPMLAISPDGTRVAYIGVHEGEDMIFLRHIHQSEATLLKGTEDSDYPFFSPDGEWIGFESEGKLKKVSVLGGPPITLCDASNMRGATWGTDGTIVFAPQRSGGLMRVSEAGGDPTWLTDEAPEVDSIGNPSNRWPDMLPGDETVIFTATPNNSVYKDAEIVALSLVDGTRTTLVRGGTFGRYVPPGFLVYARENSLFATRFDPETLEISGPTVPVLEEVNGANSYGSKHLTFSDNGTLLYLKGASDFGVEELVWLDENGVETPASKHELNYGAVSLSPDERYVALEIFSATEEVADIWVLELERDLLTRLTFADSVDRKPIWSPDGRWIVYSSTGKGQANFNLFRVRADGTGEPEQLASSERRQLAESWSPDGATLAFFELGGETSGDLFFYREGADPEVEPFLTTRFGEFAPSFSPDGRWIAYSSDMSGEPECYVRRADGEGPQTLISTSGGRLPLWSRDGTELRYRSRDRKMMAVGFTVDGDTFRPDLPRELFDFPGPPYSFLWDTSSDGRTLAYKDIGGELGGPAGPSVVVNWTRELEERVPK